MAQFGSTKPASSSSNDKYKNITKMTIYENEKKGVIKNQVIAEPKISILVWWGVRIRI